MPMTVFANDNGFFHKGSSGTGLAFPDVCLSPPPAPTGPVPVPYPNNVSAGDLSNGSKTVKIDGNETALEDKSFLSTSTGDEAGNQGGSVITHVTKGKGYFKMWSFDVKVEGKGVDRHLDPIGQNCQSDPFSGMTPASKTKLKKAGGAETDDCPEKYVAKEHRPSMVKAQYDAVAAGPCWQCKSPDPQGWKKAPGPGGSPAGTRYANPKGAFVPDHQPPSFVIWYLGGCQDEDEFKKKFQDPKGVKPHCKQCSDKQGGFSALSRELRKLHSL